MRGCERIGNDLLRLEKFVNLNYTGRLLPRLFVLQGFITIIRATIIHSRYSSAAAGEVNLTHAGFRKLLKKHDKFAGVQFLPMCALAT